MKKRISFHIEHSEIFHNFRKKIISHSASPNISLIALVTFLCYEFSLFFVRFKPVTSTIALAVGDLLGRQKFFEISEKLRKIERFSPFSRVPYLGLGLLYNRSRTTVCFVFERDSESLSFHSCLAHSLHKPYKGLPALASGFGSLCLTGLFHSAEMLTVVSARRRKLRLAALRLCVSSYKLVLFYYWPGKGELYDRLQRTCFY